jgi:hypothetical protein
LLDTGISVTEELLTQVEDGQAVPPKEAQAAMCQQVFDAVTNEYVAMKKALDDSSERGPVYQQPWLKQPLPV